jgi:rubrerythrin
MIEFVGPNGNVLVEGYTGFPVETQAKRGPLPGSIEWLLQAIERHAIAEEDSLDQYEYLATASDDPIVALVMRLILEDEGRHHGLLKRIEASLRDALDWTHSPNALPASTTPQYPVPEQLAETTHVLIEEELNGARHLRELAREERRIDAGLHSLLLEMMAMDSEKHARLLQFVRDRLAARARLADGPSD